MQLFWAVVIGIGIGDVAGLWTTISDAVRMHPQLDRLRILSLGSAAPYLVMVLSLIAGLTFRVRWTRWQWLVLGMAVSLSIVALILTYTRSMWIVCVVVMVMFAALQKTWWPSVVAVLLIMGLGVGLATSPVIQGRTRMLTDLHRDASLVERYEIWGAALNMVRDHPMLGVGAKCFTVHSERYHVPNGQHQAHNQLMNVAAETGMVGLICFLAWVAYYAAFLFKLRQLRTGTISRAMWLAAMGSFVVVAAHGVVDATFGAELALLFMLITGCLIAAKALEDSPLEGSAPSKQASSEFSF